MNFERKNNSWLFAGVLLTCFFVSVWVRYQQFETWKKTPVYYFVGERPLMTTLDAPYWLRWAREYKEGIMGEKDGLRNYPDATEIFKEKSYEEFTIPMKYTDFTPSNNNASSLSGTTAILNRDVPLLSILIAHITPFFNYNYYLTGTLLIPILASFFILPLGIYFLSIGLPLSGLLGGLIGTFASGYYMRSSIGRIDTDMLNLFFPLLTGLLVLLAGKAKKERNVMLYSIGAGLSLYLFQWWYNQPGFSLAYFMVLIFSMFVQKIRLYTIILSAFLFVLCVNPATFMIGADSVKKQFNSYFQIKEVSDVIVDTVTNSASFPNTMTTISEVDHVPMKEVLRRVLSNTILSWIGILAFFGMAILKWRVLLPLAPLLMLGILSFQSSNRFIMYLAPFIGIGLGWLLQLGVEGVFLLITKNIDRRDIEGTEEKGKRLRAKGSLWAKIITWLSMDSYANWKAPEGTKNAKTNQQIVAKESAKNIYHRDTEVDWWNWARQGSLYMWMGVFFWLISEQTAISFVPGPSIHPRLYATFFEVKKRVSEDAALLTWWDYGYAITDATGLATFHDGGSQTSPKTYFIARGLISHDQDELFDITQYLATEGNPGISKNNTSPQALMQAVRNPTQKPWDPIYLFFTADMTAKYGAISKLGSWDIEKGGSKPRTYQNLACNKITKQEMSCRGAKIDLKAGFINNKLALRRLIFIRNGHVLREQKFGHNQGFTIQLIVAGNNIVEVQLIDETVFSSNYNQMFLLGRYRKDLFEETYNAFPISRLYRMKE